MKKRVKAAVIAGACCMALGVSLSGIGAMAGGLEDLDKIDTGINTVRTYSVGSVTRTGIYGLPGIGNVLWTLDRLDDMDDILENRWDRKEDELEEKWDALEEEWDRNEDAREERWDALEDRLEREYGDEWEDYLERKYGEDWEDYLEREYGEDLGERLEQEVRDWTDGLVSRAAHYAEGYADEEHHAEHVEDTLESNLKRNAAEAAEGKAYSEKAESGQEIYTGDFETDIAYSGSLKKLDVEMGLHDLLIAEGEGNTVHLTGVNADKVQCYVKNGTLHLKDVGEGVIFHAADERRLTLTVPAGIVWDKAELGMKLACLEVPKLAAAEADLETEVGAILAGTVNAQKLDADTEMGAVEVQAFTAGTLDISTSMGSVEMAGTVSGNAEISTEMGSVELTLHQDAASLNYRIENEMGSVSIDGKDYGPISDKKTEVSNGAPYTLEAEAEMGSVTVLFDGIS